MRHALAPFLPAVAVLAKIAFAFTVVIWLSSFAKVRASDVLQFVTAGNDK